MSDHLTQFGDIHLSVPFTSLTKKQWQAVSEQLDSYVSEYRMITEHVTGSFMFEHTEYGTALLQLNKEFGFPEIEVPKVSDDPIVQDVINQRIRLLRSRLKELMLTKQQNGLEDKMKADRIEADTIYHECRQAAIDLKQKEIDMLEAKRQARFKAQKLAIKKAKLAAVI